MNIRATARGEGALSTIGWDDDGVAPDDFMIVKNGMFNELSDDPRAGAVARVVVRQAGQGHALARLRLRRQLGQRLVPAHAQRVAAPPGARGPGSTTSSPPPTAASPSSATDRSPSTSSDTTRNTGGQVYYEIKGGKIAGMLERRRLPDSHARLRDSMDMIGGAQATASARSFIRRQGPARIV